MFTKKPKNQVMQEHISKNYLCKSIIKYILAVAIFLFLILLHQKSICVATVDDRPLIRQAVGRDVLNTKLRFDLNLFDIGYEDLLVHHSQFLHYQQLGLPTCRVSPSNINH